EERRVDLEGRVLGGGTHEHDGALLDVRQERVLLGLVEAVDLVDEENGAASADGAFRLGLGRDLTYLLHAREYSREGRETRTDHLGHEPSESGLTGAWRSPEDHRVQRAVLERAPQHLAGPDQMLLPDDLVEASRPHPIGERARRYGRVGGRWIEQVHAGI